MESYCALNESHDTFVVPVDERAGGAVLPRPHVQRVERRQAEAIGALESMKQLTHELRRIAGCVASQSSARTRKSAPVIRRRPLGSGSYNTISGRAGSSSPVEDQRQVHVVQAHRTDVWPLTQPNSR